MSNHPADSKDPITSKYSTTLLDSKKKIWAREKEEFREWFPFGSRSFCIEKSSMKDVASGSTSEATFRDHINDQRPQYLSNPCLSIHTEENSRCMPIQSKYLHCCCCCHHHASVCYCSHSFHDKQILYNTNDKLNTVENQESLECAPNIMITPAVSPIPRIPSPSYQMHLCDSAVKNAASMSKCRADSTPNTYSALVHRIPNNTSNFSNSFRRRNLITDLNDSFEKLAKLDAKQQLQLEVNKQLTENKKLKSIAQKLEYLEVSRLKEEATNMYEQEKVRSAQEEEKKKRDEEEKEKLRSLLHARLQAARIRAEREKSARLREHVLKGSASLPSEDLKKHSRSVVQGAVSHENRSTIFAPKFRLFGHSDDDTTHNSNRSSVDSEAIIHSILEKINRYH